MLDKLFQHISYVHKKLFCMIFYFTPTYHRDQFMFLCLLSLCVKLIPGLFDFLRRLFVYLHALIKLLVKNYYQDLYLIHYHNYSDFYFLCISSLLSLLSLQ